MVKKNMTNTVTMMNMIKTKNDDDDERQEILNKYILTN
jgi:hypothetical protein